MHSTHRSLAAAVKALKFEAPSVSRAFLGEWAGLGFSFRCHGLDMAGLELNPVGKGSVSLNVVPEGSESGSDGIAEEFVEFCFDLYPELLALSLRVS